MRARLLLGSFLALFSVIGCAKIENHLPATSEFEAPKPDPVNPTASSPSDARELAESDFSPAQVTTLVKKLEEAPEDTNLLLRLAKLTQANLGTGDELYEGSKRAATYLHRALKIDPQIAETESFREIAGEVFYNEACALAREKKDDASIKSLVLAVKYGWTNFRHMSKDPDLKRIRETDGYTVVEKMIRENGRSKVAASVAALFRSKLNFAFDFDLTDTEGQRLTKNSFAGKALMVNIWGTWCGPCRAELPDIVAAYEKYKDQGFEIVGLNSETQTGTTADRLIKKAQESHHITYRCALADSETLQQIPNLEGIPASLFFDRDGKLKAMTVGMIDKVKLELIIERLLKDSSTTAKESVSVK